MGFFKRKIVMFEVSVPDCRIGPRYDVKARTIKLGSTREEWAVTAAVRMIAAREGIPPWKPWQRELAEKATVRRYEQEVDA